MLKHIRILLCILSLTVAGSATALAASNARTITENETCTPSVSLEQIVELDVNAYAIEESVPGDLVPSNISDDGAWDKANRKIKWGPFFSKRQRTLSYEIWGSNTTHIIDGVYSIDGASDATSGDSSVTIAGVSGSLVVRTVSENHTDTPLVSLTPIHEQFAYAVEDSVPIGLEPQNINENGSWDSFNRKVKWGLFDDSEQKSLTYEVAGDDAMYPVSGVGSFDGASVGTSGDDCLVIGDGDLAVSDIVSAQGTHCEIEWPSTEGRLYTIEKSTNLFDGFSVVAEGIAATPPMNCFTDVVNEAACAFYRIISVKP